MEKYEILKKQDEEIYEQIKKERNAEKTRNKMTTMSKKLSVRSDKFSKTSLEKDWR